MDLQELPTPEEVDEWFAHPVTRKMFRDIRERIEDCKRFQAYHRDDPFETLCDIAENQGALMLLEALYAQYEDAIAVKKDIQEEVNEQERH